MKKTKCPICQQTAGRRSCHFQEGELICSLCCAQKRGPACGSCPHYEEAALHELQKKKKAGTLGFTIRIIPEVDEKLDKALSMLEHGTIKPAEAIIRSIYQENPHYHMANFAMGLVEVVNKNELAALEYFERAIEIFPYFVEAWFNKASLHQTRVQLPEMVFAFRKVAEYGSEEEDFVIAAKERLRSLEDSIHEREGMSLNEYLLSAALFDDAFFHLNAGKYDVAIRKFREVIKGNPKHTPSWGNIGICLGFKGDKQGAVAAFDKALEIDPKYTPAKENRAIVERLAEGECLPQGSFRVINFGAGRI